MLSEIRKFVWKVPRENNKFCKLLMITCCGIVTTSTGMASTISVIKPRTSLLGEVFIPTQCEDASTWLLTLPRGLTHFCPTRPMLQPPPPAGRAARVPLDCRSFLARLCTYCTSNPETQRGRRRRWRRRARSPSLPFPRPAWPSRDRGITRLAEFHTPVAAPSTVRALVRVPFCVLRFPLSLFLSFSHSDSTPVPPESLYFDSPHQNKNHLAWQSGRVSVLREAGRLRRARIK